jgi:hypothetical protein
LEAFSGATSALTLNQQEFSTMEYINPVLLLILIAQICLAICAWQSPQFLRRVAAHLLTRADVLDVARRESARSMKVWMNELGLEDLGARAAKSPANHQFYDDEAKSSLG